MKNTRIFLSPPHMGESEQTFVKEAFESNYIAPLGPQVDAFEKAFSEYTGIKYCVALSSGTAAMHLALRYLGVGPGDEVFASTLTFIGSVSPATFLGAIPVFIDCERESWNMDPALLEAELEQCARRGKLPKAVIPTDLYGQCCDYDRIYAICGQYGIPVIVDAAEAMGAQYYPRNTQIKQIEYVGKGNAFHAGFGARAAVFSFNGNKIMTTSGGGMLASDDRDLIDKARFWSQQAREPFPHYEHTEIGYNYRMSNILAAIGRGQLQVLGDRVRRKREIFQMCVNGLNDLPGVAFMPEPNWSSCNRWLTVMLIDSEIFKASPETIRLALEAENIESRPLWKPMHCQPVFDPQITRIDADYGTEWENGFGPQITRIDADYGPEGEKGFGPQITRIDADYGTEGEKGFGPQITRIDADYGTEWENERLKVSDKAENFEYAGKEEKARGKSKKKAYPCRVVGGAVSEELFKCGLCLPSGTAMTDGDLNRVIRVVRGARGAGA